MRSWNLVLAAFVALGSVAAFVGCEHDDGPGFGVQDALGNYDVTVDPNVILRARYAGHSPTSSTVDLALIAGYRPVWSEFGLTYDSALGHFVLRVNENGTLKEIYIDNSRVVAIGEYGSPVPFTPTATNLRSVSLRAQLQVSRSELVSTGCEIQRYGEFWITMTAAGITGGIHQFGDYVTIATNETPYVACRDYLAEVEERIRRGEPESSDLARFVANGALDINKMQKLAGVEHEIKFSGTKAPGAAMSANAIVPSGGVLRLELRTARTTPESP